MGITSNIQNKIHGGKMIFKEMWAGMNASVGDDYFLRSVETIMRTYVLKPNVYETQRSLEIAVANFLQSTGCYTWGCLCGWQQNPPDVIKQGKIVAYVEFRPTRMHEKRRYLCTIQPKEIWDANLYDKFTDDERYEITSTAVFIYQSVDHA
jgi:hypothetical protein